MIKSFKDLVTLTQQRSFKSRMAVANAHEKHTIESVVLAKKDGLCEPILVGVAETISALLSAEGEDPAAYRIIDAPDGAESARTAIRLIREGEAEILMKGAIETGPLMKEVINKETGLNKGVRCSLVGTYEIPGYHKILAINDVGMNTYPDLYGKRDILLGAVELMHGLGVSCPKVAVLSAVEKLNPKMPDTVDGDALKTMWKNGEFPSCIVEGPIAFDLATRKEAAEIKHYESPVAGDADILIVPDIVSGNVLAKALTGFAGARTAGIVVGAAAPIVLSSRSALVEDKYYSIALAAYAAGKD